MVGVHYTKKKLTNYSLLSRRGKQSQGKVYFSTLFQSKEYVFLIVVCSVCLQRCISIGTNEAKRIFIVTWPQPAILSDRTHGSKLSSVQLELEEWGRTWTSKFPFLVRVNIITPEKSCLVNAFCYLMTI